MADLFGWTPPPKVFQDIRNTRQSTSELKAELVLTLGLLCSVVPDCVRNGSINKTHEWLRAREQAMKVCKAARSSVPELTAKISDMRRFT